jgi:hypothetical protein
MSDDQIDYPIIPHCTVCGLIPPLVRLIRLTFIDTDRRYEEPLSYMEMMELVIAKKVKANDSLVCEECIRGIKKIRFSDLESYNLPDPPTYYPPGYIPPALPGDKDKDLPF